MKTILFEEKTTRLWIKIELYDTKDNQLIIHGHDIGEAVKSIKGRYDYEYIITIEEASVQELLTKTNLSTVTALIGWFIIHFSTDTAVSEIRKELERLSVPYDFFTW